MTIETRKYIFEVDPSKVEPRAILEFEGNVIMSASWEGRSQELIDRLNLKKVGRLILIRYKNKGKTGRSGNIRNKIKDTCKKNSIEMKELMVDSVGGDYSYHHSIVADLAALMITAGGAWLIDISSLPRRIWTSLVLLLDSANLIRKVSFYYSRPKYIFEEDAYRKVVYRYTEGDWSLIEPPFSALHFDGGLHRKNIISAGFEYDKLKSVIYAREAEKNVVIYASPGFCDEYTKIAEETARRIQTVFSVAPTDVIPVAIGDFCGVLETVTNIIEGDQSFWDQSIICAGNKLHSLALCYVKAAFPAVHFYLRVPRAYRENATPGNGECDVISVTNKLAPI